MFVLKRHIPRKLRFKLLAALPICQNAWQKNGRPLDAHDLAFARITEAGATWPLLGEPP